MAFKMKGPSLYPNYRGNGSGAKGAIPNQKNYTGQADGRATSSPFQMHDGEKHKATATHFADGTPKSKRDKFNDAETKKETLNVKKGSAADKKGKKKKTLNDYLNEGFSQVEAEQMFKNQAITGRV